jgi:hypothetical protein
MTPAVPDPVIGRRLFTDGVTRAVHGGPDGREYVIGHDGGRIYGTWLLADAEPDTAIIVVAPRRQG